MTVRAPDISRLFALWLAVGLSTVAAGCRGSDSSTAVENVAFASRSQQFEDSCKHQFPPGRHRDECIDEARRGRCVRECQPRRDAGVDVPKGAPDAGRTDAAVADGHSITPDAGAKDATVVDAHQVPDAGAGVPDAMGVSCPTVTAPQPSVSGPISVGNVVELLTKGVDPDATGAATITLQSTGGVVNTFSSGQDGTGVQVLTDFQCTRAATETITATISEGACHASASTNIVCSLCGDGIIEQGEQCDPPHKGPDGLQCGADCQLLTCGNGVIDPGEQCDPPKSSGSGPLCTQTCQIPTCGNGVIEPGETCDPPNTAVCDSNCQLLCGNGVIDPGETCDFPSPAICNQCQLTTCGGCYFQAIGGDPACLSLSGTARTTCLDLLSCMASGLAGCFFLPGGTGNTACFCSDATCSAGANGRCAPLFEAVAGSTDPMVVLQQLNDPTSLLSRVRNEGEAFANFPGCGMFCRSL